MKTSPRDAAPISELIEEVIETFRQLRRVSAELHGDGAVMPGERGVLMDLARRGPHTVAGMAHERGVSRQHVQTLVDRFRNRGLTELAENPHHRRSKLVCLTRKGMALVKTMEERERSMLRRLRLGITPAQFRSAIGLLRKLRGGLPDQLRRLSHAKNVGFRKGSP